MTLKEQSLYMIDRGVETLSSVKRLASNDAEFELLEGQLISNLRETVLSSRILAENVLKGFAQSTGLSVSRAAESRLRKLEAEATSIVPRRRFRGPVSTRPWVRKMTQHDRDALWRLEKEHREDRILNTLAIYWANGERSLLEISRLVELEAGRSDLEYLLEQFRFLEKMGLIELIRRS